jgi:hypothetical protein
MKAEISTMSLSADQVYLPMSDTSDNAADMPIDFHAMADRVSANLRRMKVPVEQQAGVMKQLWSDLIDGVFAGGKKGLGGLGRA